MYIIYLIPKTGYATDLRSDTLWGSICWGIQRLWGDKELEDFIQRSKAGTPDFVLSSAFPYKLFEGKKIPFFPNPLSGSSTNQAPQNPAKRRDAFRLRKKLKNIKLLSLDDFEALLHGTLNADTLLERLSKEQQKRMEAAENETEYFPSDDFVKSDAPKRMEYDMTHNAIDRLRGGTLNIIKEEDGEKIESGQLFHAAEYWWTDAHNDAEENEPNAGLFFLADGDEKAIKEYLEPVLRLWRHIGVGADRTAGKGVFDYEIQAFNMPEPAEEASNAVLNLSLFRPTRPELALWEKPGHSGCLQYQLEQRQGFVGGYRHRREKEPRLYFSEGAVFERPESLKKRYMGDITLQTFDDLDHKVWDNGFGFMVNLNWKKT